MSVKYEIGDIIKFSGIVHTTDNGIPCVSTDGSSIELIGKIKVGDFVRRGHIVFKVSWNCFVDEGFKGLMPATKEEYDQYVRQQEEAKIKDVSTETLMAEIVRRHREKPIKESTV